MSIKTHEKQSSEIKLVYPFQGQYYHADDNTSLQAVALNWQLKVFDSMSLAALDCTSRISLCIHMPFT